MAISTASGRFRGLAPLYFLVPLVIYLLTVAPSLGFGDAAILIHEIQEFELGSHVNDHNFTIVVGWLFARLLPFGNPALKANLVSSVLSALAVGFFALAIREAVKNEWVALSTALAFGVSQSLWWSATIIENCAANVLFLALSLHALRRSRTKTAAFLAGLSIFNHVQLGFWCAGLSIAFLVEAIRRRRGGARFFAANFGALLLGLAPWLVLVARTALKANSLPYALEDAFVGGFEGFMLQGSWAAAFRDLLRLTVLQAPSPALPLLAAGAWFYYRRHGLSLEALATGLLFAGNTGFFMFYNTWDKFTFLLPSFMVLFLWSSEALSFVAGAWLGRLGRGPRRLAATLYFAATLALPPFVYTHLTSWGKEPGLNLFGDYRNPDASHLYRRTEYVNNPLKHGFRDVDEFAELVFEKLPPNAILIDDDSRTAPDFIYYYQPLLKKRTDLQVLMATGLHSPGWGTPAEEIYRILLRARDTATPLFIVSVQFPHKLYLKLRRPEDGITFTKFPLDGKRWIYRMTASPPR